MATQKQREAARKNIRKAQAAWKSMSHRQHAQAQPEGWKRKKTGTGGEGDYYHVGVRPKEDFVTFRTQDVGEPGHVQKVVTALVGLSSRLAERQEKAPRGRRVFLAHSLKDRAFVEREILPLLERYGIQSWLAPEQKQSAEENPNDAGHSYQPRIAKATRNLAGFIPVLWNKIVSHARTPTE